MPDDSNILNSAAGAVAPAGSVTFVRTLSFSIYQRAKYKYSAFIGQATGGEEPLVIVNRPGSVPTPQTVMCFAAAGATAGAFITAIACVYPPTLNVGSQLYVPAYVLYRSFRADEAVRSDLGSYGESYKLQHGRSNPYELPAKGYIQDSLKHRDAPWFCGTVLRLWASSTSVLVPDISVMVLISVPVRDTIGTAIYFSTYESTKQLLVKFQGSNSPTSPLSVAIAGGVCGLVSWACVRAHGFSQL